jgi:hypothetical protein
VQVTDLSYDTRQRMTAALKRGESLHLRLRKPMGRGVRGSRNCRLDEIVPLCASVELSGEVVGYAGAEWAAPSGVERGDPSVTVVIPTRGDSSPAVDAFLAQDVNVRVLILSNGNGPDSQKGAEVIRVNWRGHGATRQAAIARVNTPFVFFTVDDAIPLGTGFLRTLVSALEGGDWDAVTARQIPWPDADAVTATRLRRWTPPGHQVVARSTADHVATLYRTETLRAFPIPSVPIAEDAWWSIGRRIGYVPTAPVLHSHQRSPGALYRRNRDIHAQLRGMGYAPKVPSLSAAFRAMPGVLRPALANGPPELLNQLAELMGQWRGAVLGR